MYLKFQNGLQNGDKSVVVDENKQNSVLTRQVSCRI